MMLRSMQVLGLGIDEANVNIPMGTVMIDLGDFRAVLGGKGRWRATQIATARTFCDCPNDNLSWMWESQRTASRKARRSRGRGRDRGEEGKEGKKERIRRMSGRHTVRKHRINRVTRISGLGRRRLGDLHQPGVGSISTHLSQRISLSRPRRQARRDRPVIEQRARRRWGLRRREP